MTHPSVEEVSLHLEGQLEPADERRVRTHLEQCAPCAATAQELLHVSEQLHAAGEFWPSSESTPAIPADVAARVEAALAREAGERAAGVTPRADEGTAEGVVAGGSSVGGLAERRRRRRRVMSGGLLAAAAATVVALGLGQLMQSDGSFQATGGSAGESATAQREPGLSAPQRDAPGRRPRASALNGTTQGGADTAGKAGGQALPEKTDRDELQLFTAKREDLGLIAGVAAAHSPDRAQHDLPGCVRAALGNDLGPVASYAVRLPDGTGARGVVVLRPNDSPTEGVLLACTPRPQVLARRGLHP